MQNDTHDNVRLGKMIFEAFKKSGLNQKELADLMGVSKVTPRKWFNTGSITKDNLFKLARILDLPINAIITGEGEKICEDEDKISAYAMRQLIEFYVEMRAVPTHEEFERIHADIMSIVREDCKAPTKAMIKVIAGRNIK